MIYVNSDIEFGTWSWNISNKIVTFSPNWFLSLGYPVPNNLNQGIDTWERLIGDPLNMTGVDIDLSKTSFSQKELEDNTNQYKISQLTLKEIEVCEFIKKGFNDIEVSVKLSISPNTVKTHLRNICKKFSVSGRVKLLAALYKNDLVEIDLPAIYKSK
jgi:DNA-binding CsgD family transcriptional regulator